MLAIIESPFSGKTPEEVERTRRYLGVCIHYVLMDRGADVAWASHAIGPLGLHDTVPSERHKGMMMTRHLLDHLNMNKQVMCFMFTDLGVSDGMLAGCSMLRGSVPVEEVNFGKLGVDWEDLARDLVHHTEGAH